MDLANGWGAGGASRNSRTAPALPQRRCRAAKGEVRRPLASREDAPHALRRRNPARTPPATPSTRGSGVSHARGRRRRRRPHACRRGSTSGSSSRKAARIAPSTVSSKRGLDPPVDEPGSAGAPPRSRSAARGRTRRSLARDGPMKFDQPARLGMAVDQAEDLAGVMARWASAAQNPQIAGERQAKSGADGDAADHGDRRAIEVHQRLQAVLDCVAASRACRRGQGRSRRVRRCRLPAEMCALTLDEARPAGPRGPRSRRGSAATPATSRGPVRITAANGDD